MDHASYMRGVNAAATVVVCHCCRCCVQLLLEQPAERHSAILNIAGAAGRCLVGGGAALQQMIGRTYLADCTHPDPAAISHRASLTFVHTVTVHGGKVR